MGILDVPTYSRAQLDRKIAALQSAAPERRITIPGRGPVTAIDGYGNSLVSAASTGVADDERWLSLLAGAIGAQDHNHAVNGSTIIGNLGLDLKGALARNAGDVASEAACVLWILNDPAYYGPACGPAVAAAHRALVSRILCDPGDVAAADDPALTYSAGWAAFGPTFRGIDRPGTITRPVRPAERGRIVAFNVAAVSGNGGVHTLSTDSAIDGEPSRLDTRGLYPAEAAVKDAQVLTCIRKFVPQDATSITFAVTEVATRTYVFGAQVESASPRLVEVVGQYHLPAYTLYEKAPFKPTDAVIDAINAEVAAVVSEFPSHVVYLPSEDVIGRQQQNVIADQAHLSVAGHRSIGGLAIGAARTFPAGTSLRAALATPGGTSRGRVASRAAPEEPAAPEADRVVGTDGAPGFADGWAGAPSGFRSLRFHRDPFGVVHVAGSCRSTGETAAGAAIVTLPEGHRPAGGAGEALALVAIAGDGPAVRLDVSADTGVVTTATALPAGSAVHVQASFRAG